MAIAPRLKWYLDSRQIDYEVVVPLGTGCLEP